MKPRPRLVPSVVGFEARFSGRGALRQSIGKGGRVHIDRWLPFLILHRGDPTRSSLARRIALDSPSYFVWPRGDDQAALHAIAVVADTLAARAGRLLVVTLDDQPQATGEMHSQDLPPFVAEIGAGDLGHVGRAAAELDAALREVEIDLRQCEVQRLPFVPLLTPAFDRVLNGIDGAERMSLRVPQIHRRPDGGEYPALRHDLAVAVGDALLRAACAFLDDGRTKAPDHYRALGRSAYIAAALKADRKLDEVARSFDFLLSISPIDTAKAYARFAATNEDRAPPFHYRPLTVDPDLAKRELYAIDLGSLEDPMLERLLSEKRREIDAQLTMLATRNTPAFRPASMFLYGAVEEALLADASAILASTSRDRPGGRTVRAGAIADAARTVAEGYRSADPAFAPDIQVREDIAGLLVSGDKLLIGADTVMPAHRVEALLAHEIGVHLLTYYNGAAQGLAIFRTGLAGYEGVQEGLGVFAEWAVGGLTRTRLRLLAGRVVAVDAMLHGASFIDVFRALSRDHGFSSRAAFGIAARVFRSGGLAKDAIYLQGFRAVMQIVAAGASLQPFWLGKIAAGHAAAIEELLQRGLVKAPRFTPHFLDDEGSRDRIADLRRTGSLSDVIAGA